MSDLRTAAQQALEALEDLRVWRVKQSMAVIALRAALAQQDEPAQEQDVEDAIEAAYWHFDARKKGLNEWAYAPQSERDAFKAEARKLVRGYFPTRQAQDTKREMLAVADAFIRGKRAALAQQENKTPITDDHGKALLPQYQVIEQSGNWLLLYDQMQVGEKVRHEFRIQKLRHDVALYPGITLAEAQKRFRERVEADHE